MNYYCLIAGLPDIQPEDTKGIPSLIDLKIELQEQLSDKDMQLLQLLFAKFDNDNLLVIQANKEGRLNPLGNLKSEDWEQMTDLMLEFEQPKDSRIMPYIQQYFSTYYDEKKIEKVISREDYLAGLYFEQGMQSKNKFLHDWFEFNLNVNNLLTAVSCRKFGFDLRTMVLGINEIAETIRKSNARDFGLSGMFEQLEAVLLIAEESDLMEREKKIDALKWEWLDENTFFNYFSIEKVLAFVLKAEMRERWKLLTEEKGTQTFHELLDGLKKEVEFN